MRCAVDLLLLSLLSFSHGYRQLSGSVALPCDDTVCKLPDCRCSGTGIPDDLPVQQIPQIVMITLDDGVQDDWKPHVATVLADHKNPNGCPVGTTFFASHEYTNYQLVEEYYSEGYEIATHSISHVNDREWWKHASAEEWHDEMIGTQTIFHEFANIPTDDIQGMRAPFLQTGGDNTYEMMNSTNLKYDSSMATSQYTNPPLWPYTLDYKETKDCQLEPCPTKSWPGTWIVPLVDYTDKNGNGCAMVDYCALPTDAEEAYWLLKSNFDRHYKTNKAPFGIFMHNPWFAYPHNVEGLTRFMSDLVAMHDVWIINVGQAIEWVQKPTKLSNILNFAPWQCPPKPAARCTQAQAIWCRYLMADGSKRNMATCNSTCPPNYPWVGNPKGQ